MARERVTELESGIIPLLEKEGVAARSRKCREATLARADRVVSSAKIFRPEELRRTEDKRFKESAASYRAPPMSHMNVLRQRSAQVVPASVVSPK